MAIEFPNWSPAQWRLLERLYPDACLKRDDAKAEARIGEDDYGQLVYFGQIVEPGLGEWHVELSPRGRMTVDFGRMHMFLSSIATAQPQTDQAGWMVATAKEGLRVPPDHSRPGRPQPTRPYPGAAVLPEDRVPRWLVWIYRRLGVPGL